MAGNAHELQPFCDHWLARGATLRCATSSAGAASSRPPLKVPKAERIPCPWAITMMHVFLGRARPALPGDTEGEEGAGNAWHAPLADCGPTWAAIASSTSRTATTSCRSLPHLHRLDDRRGAAHPSAGAPQA